MNVEEMIANDFDAMDPFKEEKNEIYREIRERAYWLAQHLEHDDDDGVQEEIDLLRSILDNVEKWKG